MSDLIERLRRYNGADHPLRICGEAADELERLNTLVALQKKDMKQAMDEIERLTAEVRHWKGMTKGRESEIDQRQDEIKALQARVKALEGVYDAVQNLSYADAVSGAEQWVDLREAMAAAKDKRIADLQARVDELENDV